MILVIFFPLVSDIMPKVSVIIPCYNQAEYLDEAVSSILSQTFQDFEIIIVDDGSDNENSLNILKNYEKPKTRIIRINNSGPAIARNVGIKSAKGDYILPLDADDKIGPEYLEKSCEILDKNKDIGIVYCKAKFFGEMSGEWNLSEYKFPDILLANTIFCSAFFRKSDWQDVNGYKREMEFSIEDWEFWLSLIEKGLKVYRVPDYLFFYRIKDSSRNIDSAPKQDLAMRMKIFELHKILYEENLEFILESYYKQNFKFNRIQNAYSEKIAEIEKINKIRSIQAEKIKVQNEKINEIKLNHAEEINKIKSSKSWKITKPLRKAGSFIRRF